MPSPSSLLTIGDLARRTGLSVSAIRFYEAKGLVTPIRSAGNQRRYLRSDIRRLSFAMIAQRLGLTHQRQMACMQVAHGGHHGGVPVGC